MADAKGRLTIMGQIDAKGLPDGEIVRYPIALLIEFDSTEEARKAIKDGRCAFAWGEEKKSG